MACCPPSLYVCFHKRCLTTTSVTLWFRYNARRGHARAERRACTSAYSINDQLVRLVGLVSPRAISRDDATSVTSSTVCLRDTRRQTPVRCSDCRLSTAEPRCPASQFRYPVNSRLISRLIDKTRDLTGRQLRILRWRQLLVLINTGCAKRVVLWSLANK